MSQMFSDLQAKGARIGVHETWCDASVAPVAVNQNQFRLTHLPGLFHQFRQDSVPNDFRGVIAVKIDLHGKRKRMPKTVVSEIGISQQLSNGA